MKNRLKCELGADVWVKMVVGKIENGRFWIQAGRARIGRGVQVAVATGADATTRHMSDDSVAANTIKKNGAT